MEYDGNDFESNASINCEEGHGIDYYENDKPEIKKQIKKKTIKGWKKWVNQY